MPSLVATSVRCPECGARLEVGETATTTTCAYCGTDSRIQRRTQFFQLPVKLPPPAAHEPQRIAKASRTPLGIALWIMSTGFSVVIPIAIAGIVLAHHFVKSGRGWDAIEPLVGDVDGDGVDDFVGMDRSMTPDTMRLMAVSGKDGHTIWETPSLGAYTEIYQEHRFIAGGAVVQWDKLTHLEGFDLKSGVRRWHVSAPEVVEAGCTTSDRVIVQTADKKQYALAVADGTLTPATGKTCAPDDPFANVHGASQAKRLDLAIDGMSVNEIWERGTGPRIALGVRSPGTPVSMIAAVDAAGHTLWKSELAGRNAIKLATISTWRAAISDHEVAVAYELGSTQPPGLTVFDRTTGKRRFEIVAAKTFFNVLSGVALARGAVALSLWGSLQVFDVETGAQRFVVGS